MRIGVSTSCLYPMQTEKAFSALAQAGVRETEIFFNAGCETRGEVFREICAIRKSCSMRVQAVHSYFTFAESRMLFDSYARRFQDGMELMRKLCETCRAINCRTIILHGEREPFKISEEEYIDRFGTLASETAKLGVTLTQENVVHFRSQDADFLDRMRRQLGDLFAMTLDVKQAVAAALILCRLRAVSRRTSCICT